MNQHTELEKKIVEALYRFFAREGYGAIKRVTEKIGVSVSYFNNWKVGRSPVRLRRLSEALEALGVTDEEFFYEAFNGSEYRIDDFSTHEVSEENELVKLALARIAELENAKDH